MKHLIKLLVLVLIFASCQDNDKNPLITGGNEAPFVKYFPSNAQIDLGNPDSAVTGTFDAVNPETIAKHDIFVALDNGQTLNYVLLTSVTSFPTEFNVTVADVAQILGKDISEFLPGNKLLFEGKTTSSNGTEIIITSAETINNADGETGTVAQRQAYSFEGVMICPPFDINDLVGTYDVTQNRLEGGLGITDPDPVREVIAGPGENQVTIVGGSVGFAGGDDMIVNVDTTTGALSLGEDANGNVGLAFPVGTGGLSFGSDYAEFADGGLTLSCISVITMNMPVTLSCCGGIWTLTLAKR